MIVKIESKGEIVIVGLEKTYSNDTIYDMMKFAKSEVLKNAKHVIVDCTKLEAIDSMGTELFKIRDDFIAAGGEHFYFSGLDEMGEEAINGFGSASGYQPIRNFPSVEEAIEFIKK